MFSFVFFNEHIMREHSSWLTLASSKGGRYSVSNYRPIAILPFIGKIFERCIYYRLTDYVATCNILTPADALSLQP